MTHTDLRKKFIDFFTASPRNHKEIPSSPLIPENDPTVLFITAGMHPLVPYLLGEPHPLGCRLVNIQKSMRTDDIEEVGDLRHFTFFEMLGNWSLGDYFKKEALNWSFEFLTDQKWLGFDPNKIFVSVFAGDKDSPKDDESIRIWQNIFEKAGIKATVGDASEGLKDFNRIFPYPKAKNWWGPAGTTGPCGPDSEIFFDTGLPLHDKKIYGPTCHPNCDCGRFLEIWNNVFMQYNKKPDGSFEPLKQKNVDTGMGLERMTAILEWLTGQISTVDPFETILFKNIIVKLEQASKKSYADKNNAKSMRIIADHLRASVFLITDGTYPSNKERGYVLRKIIRRAIRHGHILEINENFLNDLANIVINDYQEYYPELKINSELISSTLEAEEKKFRNTLKKGLQEINKHGILTGKIAFDLYQSYGFPLEITMEIAKDKGQAIDLANFKAEFTKHQELSRTATKGLFKGGLQDNSEATTRLHTATHLLQQALREVLGKHIRQAGSQITAERLRFDFNHPNKVTEQELRKVEEIVNQKIKANLPVSLSVMDYQEAIKSNALTVPGAKYPAKVKVYKIGDFSQEVCGGPHVDFTGRLGSFKIINEEAASNMHRRIYATLDKLKK